MKLHPSITQDRVCDLVEEQLFGTSNPGICIACGADHDECEPDASEYECYKCKEHKVYGAEQILAMIA